MSVSAFSYGCFSNAGEGILVLSAASSSFTVGNVAVWSGWDFNADGTLEEIGSALLDRTAVTGEWYSLGATTSVGDLYEVRCASMTAGTWNTQAASVGTWVDLTVGRVWFENVVSRDAPASADAGGSFEIGRVGASSAIVTATLTASANN